MADNLIEQIDDSIEENSILITDNEQSSVITASSVSVFTSSARNNSIIIVNNNENTENDTVDDTEDNDVIEESDEEDYSRFRAKIPRLDLDNSAKKPDNSNVKDSKTKEEEVEEEVCSICLEPWTNAGLHRIVCLKCGHLFGQGCIERWLKSNQKCPQCNCAAKKTDIRKIYSKAIKVLDTAELDKALKDIDQEKQLRRKAEISSSEMKLQLQLVRDELDVLKIKYKNLIEKFNQQQHAGGDQMSSSSRISSAEKGSMSYGMDKLINLTETNGGCRVITFSSKHLAILASQPSNNPIFPGFGIKKINFLDYKLSQYVPIHSKLIRDMCLNLSNEDDILLTCGLDKTIKLTNLVTNRLIHSYECALPIWSCAINNENPLYFYAGLANGQVLLFDKRKIDSHVQILNADYNTGSPVCSLQFVPKHSETSRPGLLVSQLDRICFLEAKQDEEYKYHSLLLEGGIMCCSYESQTKSVLVSARPSSKYSYVRHLVYELNAQNQESEINYSLNHVQTYNGSSVQKLLAKTRLYTYQSQLYGCAPCESTKSAMIWNVKTGETCSRLNNSTEVLDVCPIQYRDNHYMCTLTDKQLRVFKKA